MTNIKPLYLVIAAILVGGIGFYAGVQFQLSKTPTMMYGQRGWNINDGRMNGQRNFGNTNNSNGNRPMMGGFRPITGEILNMDSTSMTVKLVDGSSRIVILSATTPVATTAEAKISDLKNGDKVGVFGTTNADGSVTAQSIELNPRFGILDQK